MKTRIFLPTILSFLFLFQHCKKGNIINSPGAVPGTYYFEISDNVKIKYFESDLVLLKKSGESQSTKLVKQISSFQIIQQKGVFRLLNNLLLTKNIFVNGINQFELIYPDGKIDKFVLNIKFSNENSDGIVTFDKLIYNNIEIKSETRSNPISPSYFFVLN